MPPKYPILWDIAGKLMIAVLTSQQRKFSSDSVLGVDRINPELKVIGVDRIATAGPCIVTVNHYSRPGFRAWWLAMAVSAVIPYEVHWVMTAGWTFADSFRSNLITPLTRWVFTKVAEVYGFSTMPPMPPRELDLYQRVQTIRDVISYVHSSQIPVVGLAPEGMDSGSGELGLPPPGLGKFVLFLSKLGLCVLPVGIFEADDRLIVSFGNPYRIEIKTKMNKSEQDRIVRWEVMNHIALLLPERLRGIFG